MNKPPSIALIHGWATEPTIWAPVRAELESQGHAVTVYEMPGYGQRRNENGNITFEQLVADAMDVLRCHDLWIGWSLGAMVALNAAARNHPPCKGVFAVCPTAKFCIDEQKKSALDQLRISVESDADKAAARFRRTMPSTENRRAFVRQLNELKPSNSQRSTDNDQSAGDERRKETLLAGLEMLATTDLSGELNKITVPVDIVSGDQDAIIPSDSGKRLQSMITDCRYTTLPCGHVPFLECPQRFMELLFDFATKLTDASTDPKSV